MRECVWSMYVVDDICLQVGFDETEQRVKVMKTTDDTETKGAAAAGPAAGGQLAAKSSQERQQEITMRREQLTAYLNLQVPLPLDARAAPPPGDPVPVAAPEQLDLVDRPAKKQKRFERFEKYTTTVRHSMVSTCRIATTTMEKCRSFKDWCVERCSLPPRQVSSTKHSVVGKALVDNLETFIFGMQLVSAAPEIFRSAGILVVYFIITMDGATPNETFVDKLAAYLHTAVFIVHIWLLWIDRCYLHRLGRCMVAVLDRHRVTGHLYALSRAFHMFKPFDKLEAGLHSIFMESFDGNAPPPPGRGDLWPFVLETLRLLFLTTWGSDDWHNEENDFAFNEFWAFFVVVGDILSTINKLKHRCNDLGACGLRRCTNPAARAERGWARIKNLFFCDRVPQFKTGRWRKLLPAIVYWARLLILLGKHFVEAAVKVKVADLNDDVQEKIGKRYTKALTFLQDPLTPFRLALILIIAQAAEKVVCMIFFFSEGGRGLDCRKAHLRGTAISKDNKSEMSVQLKVMREIRGLAAKVYMSWKSADYRDQSSPFYACNLFWPEDGPTEERDHLVAQTALTFMAQVWTRFEAAEFAHPPHKYVPCEGLDRTSVVWQQAAVDFASYRLCDLKLMLHGWRQLLEKEPEAERGEVISDLTCGFVRAKRMDTLGEEGAHGFQKIQAGACAHYQPFAWTTQASDSVLQDIKSTWSEHGGRNLDDPEAEIRSAYTAATANRRKTAYQRGAATTTNQHIIHWAQGQLKEHGLTTLPPAQRGPHLKAYCAEFKNKPMEEQRRRLVSACVCACCFGLACACCWQSLLARCVRMTRLVGCLLRTVAASAAPALLHPGLLRGCLRV